ncbi:MAG TPA: SDR family oxidoreductase, partial [Pirellulaceae bacterium]|nr:SDR family oxidoreductase [Pirellulaceae bacterium]
SRLVGDRMKQRDRNKRDAVILNLGWDQAEHGMAGDSGEMFAAVKGAVMAFSKSLAQSLAPRVRVNCLAPGWIKTSWGDEASEYWQERARRESLLDRWGTPEDVARVAKFLASPAASFISGQIVPVNGGFRWAAQD